MLLRLVRILFVACCCTWALASVLPDTPGSTYGRDSLEIISPLPNERFVTNETVTLKVLLKHRPVDASQVVWTSSKSGVLGNGAEIQVSKLLPGTHTITVSIAGETQSVSIREFENLLDLYQAPPAEAEIKRIRKDFAINWMDGAQVDEKWAAYDPPTFNQASLTPSKIVVLANLDVLRHQAFSEPLPFGDGRTIYEHFRKYVRQVNLLLDCGDNSGGGGIINLRRWQNSWSFQRRDCKSITPTDGQFRGYAGPLFLMMHEARHNERGEPGHHLLWLQQYGSFV